MGECDSGDSGLWPLVFLIAALLLCLALLYLHMPYTLLAMLSIGSSIVAFAYLDFDPVSLVSLLPLFLAACFCVIRGYRHDLRKTDKDEQSAGSEPPPAGR